MTILVVVESPNKIPKISKCLGPGYRVVATVGHFRDLPERELGVDLQSFQPTYVTDPDKARVVAKLKEEARTASQILLGTDADREGEAIAWHAAQVINAPKALRIRFQEITPAALKKAVAAAAPIDQHLVDAQQARRVLDRLVGFQVSPLLSPLGSNHSAGRVQTAALHLVVARERERDVFKPEAFWVVKATYVEGFEAKVAARSVKGDWSPARLKSKQEALAAIAEARAHQHVVEELKVDLVERRPKPPFTTSTLQQFASSQLKLKPAETMALAQSLFEKGAITYHRTDSVALSEEAIAMAREFIRGDAPALLPDAPVKYRNKDSAQEAHEAIRPTALKLEDTTLTEAEEQLFSLISRRFLASQCKPALFERTVVLLRAGSLHLVASGRVPKFESFLRYLAEDESTAEAKTGDDAGDAEVKLPRLQERQQVTLRDVAEKGDETKPPTRFSQATLVKAMESSGIGRPSTYAATVETLFSRKYLAEEKRFVLPTQRGRLVDAGVQLAIPRLVETAYTATMEAELDQVASGKKRWKDTLRAWYADFEPQLRKAPELLAGFAKQRAAEIEAVGDAPKASGRTCPRCKATELLLRTGTHGPFLSCSACKFAADPDFAPAKARCSKCQGEMIELEGKFGRYARCIKQGCDGRLDLAATTTEKCPKCSAPLRDKGSFLGCSNYPTCSFTVDAKALAKAKKAGTTCPKCGKPAVERKGKKGAFISCVGYPECRYSVDAPAKKEKAHA